MINKKVLDWIKETWGWKTDEAIIEDWVRVFINSGIDANGKSIKGPTPDELEQEYLIPKELRKAVENIRKGR